MSKAQADKWFSWAVRARANWKCERCDFRFPPPTTQLQCSHLFSRKHNVTRWHCHNAFSHCASCHAWLESRPPEFAAWATERLGLELYEKVRRDHNKVCNLRKSDFAEIAKHYKAEYNRIQDERDSGDTGWIELVNYEVV